jgi:hypothetical protein
MPTGMCTLLAAIAAMGLVAAPAVRADGHRVWHDHGHYDHGGSATAGALIGLGVGALIGGAMVASQQPYYVPPAVGYPPPLRTIPRRTHHRPGT